MYFLHIVMLRDVRYVAYKGKYSIEKICFVQYLNLIKILDFLS